MNVIYDLQAYSFSPHGGIVRIFNEILRRFAGRDDFRALLYSPARLATPFPKGPGIRHSPWRDHPALLRRVPPARKVFYAGSRAYFRMQGGDIFHPSFYPSHDPFKGLKRVAMVYDLIHETVPLADDMPDHSQFLQDKRRVLESADRIICISQATRDALTRNYQLEARNLRVVHLACDPLFLGEETEADRTRIRALLPDPGRPFILYVGSRQRYKNFHRLLQAYRHWPLSRDVDLLVAGPPRRTQDAAWEDLAPGPGRVLYLGHVDDIVLRGLYRRARFLVYPSLAEGFGIPLLEALSAGGRLALADIPVFHEIAGPCANFFDPLKPESMTACFERLSATPATEAERRMGRDLAGQFDWARCAEGIWSVYQELMEEKS